MQRPDESPPQDSWPSSVRVLGTAFGVVLTVVLLLLMLWDYLMGSVLRQSATVPPDLPAAQQMVAMLTCLIATVLLGTGQRVDRRLPPFLFALAGVFALTLSYVENPGGSAFWSSYAGSWRGPHLFIAAGCFVLAALAYWLRDRP